MTPIGMVCCNSNCQSWLSVIRLNSIMLEQDVYDALARSSQISSSNNNSLLDFQFSHQLWI